MHDHARRFARLGHFGHAGISADKPGIPDLPAAFGIKRRLVHNDLHQRARGRRSHFGAALHQGHDLPFGRLQLVTEEFRHPMHFGQLVPDHRIGGLTRTRPGRPRFGFLLGHRRIKAGHIHRKPPLAQRILRQIKRKAVSVIKLERRRPRQIGPRCHAPQLVIQQLQPALQRGFEPRLLQPQRLFDQGLRPAQFRIGRPHLLHQSRHQPVHHRILRAQHMRVPHSPPHDPPQHIAAPLVRRHHPIGDQKRRRTQMVRDHPVMRLARPVGITTRRMRRSLDQRAHQIRVIIVVLALQKRADPLQPHAGIDRLLGQRDHPAIGELLVLHENQVPDFDKPVAVLIGRAWRAAENLFAMIKENLGARAAGPGRPHPPEIVIRGDPDDPVIRQPGDFLPDISRLIVGVVHRHQQFILGNSIFLRQQLPGIGNRLGLEIVAKAEIPQHLKERMVARRVADIVEIIVLAARAHAFLCRGRAGVIARFHPGKAILELHHAGICEHQRRVIARHQRRAFHPPMAVAGEILKESRSDIVQ